MQAGLMHAGFTSLRKTGALAMRRTGLESKPARLSADGSGMPVDSRPPAGPGAADPPVSSAPMACVEVDAPPANSPAQVHSQNRKV